MISYIYSLTGMARASSQGVSLKFGMDPRLIPNLRGLAYGIVSGAGGALSPALAKAVVVAVGLLSVLAVVWAVRRVMAKQADSIEGFDLAFSIAVTASVLLSFHILAHDLVLLALPFAIVTERFVAAGNVQSKIRRIRASDVAVLRLRRVFIFIRVVASLLARRGFNRVRISYVERVSGYQSVARGSARIIEPICGYGVSGSRHSRPILSDRCQTN